MVTSARAGLILVGVLAGCATSPPCDTHKWGENSSVCLSAQTFAGRDSPGLVPTDVQVARYFDRWTKAAAAEPILGYRYPQRYWSNDITTSNQAVIAAWTADQMQTGDQAFDDVIGQLETVSLSGNSDPLADGSYIFQLTIYSVYNEAQLAANLLPTKSELYYTGPVHQDDGIWTWDTQSKEGTDDATATVVFSFGWGDCFVACDGFHQLKAVMPPADQRATVYDLGGDPLPEGIALSADTRPPPP